MNRICNMTLLLNILILMFIGSSVSAQSNFDIEGGQSRFRLPFELVNNLVIIPVELNGVEMSFLLDTGVETSLLISPEKDSLNLHNLSIRYVIGPGASKPIRALHSTDNTMKIDKAVSTNFDVYIVTDKDLLLSSRMGVPIQGIIGYDFFKDFILDFNYKRKILKVYKPEAYIKKKCRKCDEFKLSFFNNKPYLQANISKSLKKDIPVNLLIDSGLGDALWLFPNKSKGIEIPDKHFDDFLGYGIGGSVHGKRSRIRELNLGEFSLKEITASFPDTLYFKGIENAKSRDGSIGAQILKRFRVTFDYGDKILRLKPNSNFKDPFEYDMSGIVIAHNGYNLVKEIHNHRQTKNTDEGIEVYKSSYQVNFSLKPQYKVTEIRPSSPAEVAGIKKGDLILSINGKATHNYGLSQILSFLCTEEGDRIKLKIMRNSVEKVIIFRLERIL